MGGRGAPIIWDFAPIHYLLNDKIPIYCLPLQYQFSDYLPDSDKWTIGQLDKCPITKRTALFKKLHNLFPKVIPREEVSFDVDCKVSFETPFAPRIILIFLDTCLTGLLIFIAFLVVKAPFFICFPAVSVSLCEREKR